MREFLGIKKLDPGGRKKTLVPEPVPVAHAFELVFKDFVECLPHHGAGAVVLSKSADPQVDGLYTRINLRQDMLGMGIGTDFREICPSLQPRQIF